MTLDEWLNNSGLGLDAVADMLLKDRATTGGAVEGGAPVPPPTMLRISRLRLKRRQPTAYEVAQFERITRGAVRLADWNKPAPSTLGKRGNWRKLKGRIFMVHRLKRALAETARPTLGEAWAAAGFADADARLDAIAGGYRCEVVHTAARPVGVAAA